MKEALEVEQELERRSTKVVQRLKELGYMEQRVSKEHAYASMYAYNVYENYDEKVQISLLLTTRYNLEAVKRSIVDGAYVRFTHEELKILDDNNFKLDNYFSKLTDQNIDDWFWNAEEIEVD